MKDQDYPLHFYKEYLMPHETNLNDGFLNQIANEADREYIKSNKAEYVMMERSYLNSWDSFYSNTAKIFPYIESKISDEKNNPAG